MHSLARVNCPNCGKPVLWTPEQKFKPFCCERCKLIDLGEWVMEKKIIPGAPAYMEEEPFTD